MKNVMIEDKLIFLDKEYPSIKNYIYTGYGDLEDFGILKNTRSQTFYIIQDLYEKEIAYRIYKSYQKKNYSKMQDIFFLQKLWERGSEIEDIGFPIGVVTKNQEVIGQVIPYYDGCELSKLDIEKDEMCSLILESYHFIKELYDKGIYYLDIHGKNFIVDDRGIHLIDFDRDYVFFKSSISFLNHYYEEKMVFYFLNMTKALLNLSCGVRKVNTIYDLYDELEEMKVKVKKKNL